MLRLTLTWVPLRFSLIENGAGKVIATVLVSWSMILPLGNACSINFLLREGMGVTGYLNTTIRKRVGKMHNSYKVAWTGGGLTGPPSS